MFPSHDEMFQRDHSDTDANVINKHNARLLKKSCPRCHQIIRKTTQSVGKKSYSQIDYINKKWKFAIFEYVFEIISDWERAQSDKRHFTNRKLK